MKKKTIAVLVQKKGIRKYLESFFAQIQTYRAEYHDSAGTLIDFLDRQCPSAVIVEETLLPHVCQKTGKVPVIALLGGNRKKGVDTAIACKADLYVHKPFIDKDLTYQLSCLLKRTGQIDMLTRENRDLQTVNELTQLITSTLDPKDVLYRIVNKIAEIMPVTRCSVLRIDWANQVAYVIASVETPYIKTIKLSLKKYPEIVEALIKKKPVFIRNILKDPLMESVKDMISPLGVRSILVMPIIFKEKVIGTLFLRTSRARHSFSEKDMKLLKTLSDASANSLYNAFLFSRVDDEKTRLEKLTITDPLTGTYNSRYFYHRTVEEFSRSERYALPISCLMLEIDYFNNINDTYGHKIGDLVLKVFAQQLKRLSRKSDLLARYGSAEFILMLPHTSHAGAMAEAERIKNAVKEHTFKNLKDRGGITVSIGFATFPHAKIKTADELISAAGDALHQAKDRGSDHVVVFI